MLLTEPVVIAKRPLTIVYQDEKGWRVKSADNVFHDAYPTFQTAAKVAQRFITKIVRQWAYRTTVRKGYHL